MTTPDQATVEILASHPIIQGTHIRLLRQGAEARIYETTIDGQQYIAKERFPKRYRIEILDKSLRNRQTTAEIRAIERAAKHGITVPRIVKRDEVNHVIYMTRIDGITVREYIQGLGNLNDAANAGKLHTLGQKFGVIVQQLHAANLIHGDLTTSNIMYVPRRSPSDVNDDPQQMEQEHDDAVDDNYDLCVIDFGLAYISPSLEDIAVDLYVLERAIQTTHPNSDNFLQLILNTYQQLFKDAHNEKQKTGNQQNISTGEQSTSGAADHDPSVDNTQPSTAEPQLSKNQLRKQEKRAKLKDKEPSADRGTQILKRLAEVRTRGRKKSMLG